MPRLLNGSPWPLLLMFALGFVCGSWLSARWTTTPVPPLAKAHDVSYQKHATHVQRIPPALQTRAGLAAFLQADNVDQQRHAYMLSAARAVLLAYPSSSWLTVGDLRFGSDALFLERHGAVATASDIDGTRLAHAQRLGFLQRYAVENAEHLSFADNTFDLVLCKEAFHHFPRPFVAFYEMLRVSRLGVLLIEPHDVADCTKRRHNTTNDSLLLTGFRDSYEGVGNYKYQVSVRELLKAAWALRLPLVAARGLNDHYVPRMTLEAFQEHVRRLDEKGRTGQRPYNLVAVLVMKQPLSQTARLALQREEFVLVKRPPEPPA